MTRKALMIAAVAIVALTSSLGVGRAEAHWVGHPAWHYGHPGWRYRHAGRRYWGLAYYRAAPRCYATVYGTTYCY